MHHASVDPAVGWGESDEAVEEVGELRRHGVLIGAGEEKSRGRERSRGQGLKRKMKIRDARACRFALVRLFRFFRRLVSEEPYGLAVKTKGALRATRRKRTETVRSLSAALMAFEF